MVKRRKLFGVKTLIQEEVLDYNFALSPRAFYQLNPQQTEVLYSQAVEALDVGKAEHLIDAYCGLVLLDLLLQIR